MGNYDIGELSDVDRRIIAWYWKDNKDKLNESFEAYTGKKQSVLDWAKDNKLNSVQEEKQMSNSKLTFLFDDITTIKIRFKKDDEKTWTYKALKTDNIQVGDKVVVPTPHSFVVVTVTEVHEYPQVEDGNFYKWIIQRVDTTQYDALVKRDGDATAVIAKAEFEKKRQEAKEALLSGLAVNEDVQALFQLPKE